VNSTGDAFVGVQGRLTPEAQGFLPPNDANVRQKLYRSGIARHVRACVAGGAATGDARITLMKNGTPTELALVIPQGAGPGCYGDNGASVPFVVGDEISWRLTPASGSPAQPPCTIYAIAVDVEDDQVAEYVVDYCAGGRYVWEWGRFDPEQKICIQGDTISGASASDAQQKQVRAGTGLGLRARVIENAMGPAQLVLVQNGIDTALSILIPTGQAFSQPLETAATVPVSSNDLLHLELRFTPGQVGALAVVTYIRLKVLLPD
jgi:hypothetical protein